MQDEEKDLEVQVVLEDAQDDVRRLTKKLLLLNAEVTGEEFKYLALIWQC
jgi:hypothetical protein